MIKKKIKWIRARGGDQQRCIDKFLNVNIINFAKVDKGGGWGGKTLMWIIFVVVVENLPVVSH